METAASAGRGASSGGLLLRESVEVQAGITVQATLAAPPLEEVELLLAEDLVPSPRATLRIRYEAAPELCAGESPVSPDGRAAVQVVPGEPFFVGTGGQEWFRPERASDPSEGAGPARYKVGWRR